MARAYSRDDEDALATTSRRTALLNGLDTQDSLSGPATGSVVNWRDNLRDDYTGGESPAYDPTTISNPNDTTLNPPEDNSGAPSVSEPPAFTGDLQNSSPGAYLVTPPTTPAPTYEDRMLGFDWSRMDAAAGTLKYDAARVLRSYDPRDPSSWQKAKAELEKLHPGAYQFDDVNQNILLTGTGNEADRAAGYIGLRLLDRANDNSGNAWQWMAYNNEVRGPSGEGTGLGMAPDNAAVLAALSGAGSGTGTGTGTPSTPSTPTTPVTPTTPTTPTDGLSEAVRARIMALLGLDPADVSLDDPALKAASEANRRSLERSLADRRAAVAERLNARGLASSGAMDAAVERGYQDLGNTQSAFDSTLVLNEIQSRRDQIENALKIGAGLLTSDQEASLRLQLAQIDQQIQSERNRITEALGWGNIRAQDSQFYDDLAYRYWNAQQNWNSQAVLNALNG